MPPPPQLVLRDLGQGNWPDVPISGGDSVVVREWRPYVIEELNGSGAAQWRLQGLPPGSMRVGSGVMFQFENQLGTATLRFTYDSGDFDVALEVIAGKFRSVEHHRLFLKGLVRQLSKQAASLPFSVDAPTSFKTRESMRPHSDLFSWHFIRARREAVQEAAEVITRSPRRVLIDAERRTSVERASAVSPAALVDALASTTEWVRAEEGTGAYTWPIALRLEDRSGRRWIPAVIREQAAEETLDTPEHRFVKSFLEELSNTSRVLEGRIPIPPNESDWLPQFRGHLEEVLRATFLADVSELQILPTASRVLQRAFGYRELFELWRRFHAAADPFESLADAIAARDVATLYEWWVFYALVSRLGDSLGVEPLVGEVDDVTGLRYKIVARFGDGWSLTYNKTFGRGSGPWRSYSLPLRPDFVLARGDVPLIGLDAKFRFDNLDWNLLDATSEPVDGADREAQGAGLRRTKETDLYKMHTYRDALGLRASIVVFPGRSGDQSRFYSVDSANSSSLSLEDLLKENPPKGIGSLPMSPEDIEHGRSVSDDVA